MPMTAVTKSRGSPLADELVDEDLVEIRANLPEEDTGMPGSDLRIDTHGPARAPACKYFDAPRGGSAAELLGDDR